MKRMLINATHSEEIRVALADGQKLYNLDIDTPGQDRKKGNIYKGRITRVEPSLEAAFVDYGSERHGFLPYKEISRSYYTDAANKMKERPPISVAVKEGTEVIIQVNKEERSNKGAAISTYISLAGRYLVYMPENPKAGGISRRIEGKARQDLKTSLDKVNIPKDAGVIVRTAGIGRSAEELDWDLNYLDQVWTAIKTVSANRKAPFFIYQESDIFIRALRDYLRPDVGEILIDNKEVYEKARDFMQQVMPHNLKKLSYYNDTIPLFSRYQIENQIQSAFSREVQLPSGGSLVIDHTEALISIDINSARATKGSDIEETALNTNLEAADEIARQLRIRDLGGLVVIDFIDMRNNKNQKSVEQQLDEAVSNDRARIQIGKISRFGLVEMSRQRLKSSINESSQFACPRCSGHGFIRNIESLSVSILRILEEEALKPETGKVIAQVPTKVANFIINDKRDELNSLEARHSVPMLIVANEHYQSPQFDIKRLKKSETGDIDINNISLNKPESEEQAENKSSQMAHQQRQVAAVDVLVPDSQAPSRKANSGLLSWIGSLFSSESKSTTTKTNNNSRTATQNKNTRNHKPSAHNKNKQQNHKNKQKNNKLQNQKNKQQPKQQSNKKQQQQNKSKQNNKPQKQQQQAQKPVQKPNQKPVENSQKNTVVEEDTNNEQILQRPLGSVASYAANKVKHGESESPQVAQTQTGAKEPEKNKNTETAKRAPVAKPTKKTEEVKVTEEKVENTTTPKAAQETSTKSVKEPVKNKATKTSETQTEEKPKPTKKAKTEKATKEKVTKEKPKSQKPKSKPKPKKVEKSEVKTNSKEDTKTKAKAKTTPKAKVERKTKETTKKPASVDKATPEKTKTIVAKKPTKSKKTMPDSTQNIDFDI